jgi:hypothetical protein
MTHYVIIDDEGLYHVQNMVIGRFPSLYDPLGQHHVHTKSGFQQWIRENEVSLDDLGGWLTEEGYPRAKGGFRHAKCDCGLEAGQVREHDGRVHQSRYI